MPYMGKIGIGLISFDRHHYFKRLVASLEGQTNLSDVDFHLFQEGSVNKFSRRVAALQGKLDRSISVFDNSKLPNKTKHIQQHHVGTAINQFEAVEYLAKNYEYFMVIEDDVVLSRHYIQLMRVLFGQYLPHDDVFSVSLGFVRHCKPYEIGNNLDKMIYKNTHWWAEGWYSKNWEKVRKYFLYYYQFVQNCDYKQRPAAKITRMFNSHGFYIPQTSQDAGKDFALYKSGMRRIVTTVNRGLSIGERGTHFKPGLYKRMGLAQQVPYEFGVDSNLREFKL